MKLIIFLFAWIYQDYNRLTGLARGFEDRNKGITILGMPAVFFCLLGVGLLLGLSELLARKKVIRGEDQRKFLHITAGTFIAFWPWLITWRQLQLISLAMLAGVIFIRLTKTKIHFLKDSRREGYGEIYFALAILVSASLTDVKVFFAIAILHLALADGFAAVIGKRYGQKMSYKVFKQTKTIIGSMSFWLISLAIFGAGAVFAYNSLDFSSYVILLILMPPILMVIENITNYGLDNIVIPLAVLAALQVAQLS